MYRALFILSFLAGAALCVLCSFPHLTYRLIGG